MKNKQPPIPQDIFNKMYGKSPLFDLLYHTGLRASECVALIEKWDGENQLEIDRKGNKPQMIYLSERALYQLKNHYDFLKTNGVNRFKMTKHVKKLAKDCGWDLKDWRGKPINCSSHNLRATFATHLLENGVDLVTVSTLMNHSKLETTAKYIQLSEATQRDAVDSINNPDATYAGKTVFELKKLLMLERKANKRMQNQLKMREE